MNGGPIEVLDPADIILRNTGKKPTGQQKLVAGAVQSELNKIFNTQLAVDGWYGTQTAGTVRDLQKILSLPATGILDAQTFYQLELAYANGVKFTRSAAQAGTSIAAKPTAGSQGTGYSIPGDYNGNGIPDLYYTEFSIIRTIPKKKLCRSFKNSA